MQEIPKLKLLLLDGVFAVCRLSPEATTPEWAVKGNFWSLTRSPQELSVVCGELSVPEGVQCEKGWRALRVEGTFDFSLVGILSSLTAPLARAGISVFALSTYDTDYLFVKEENLQTAVKSLENAGFTIR